MTDYEFTQTMREVGYEVHPNNCLTWRYKMNESFWVYEDKEHNLLNLHISIGRADAMYTMYTYHYTFENISTMNADEFKKKLSGISEYANLLYKDINSRIDALSKKMETYAGLLNDEFKN